MAALQHLFPHRHPDLWRRLRDAPNDHPRDRRETRLGYRREYHGLLRDRAVYPWDYRGQYSNLCRRARWRESRRLGRNTWRSFTVLSDHLRDRGIFEACIAFGGCPECARGHLNCSVRDGAERGLEADLQERR